MPTDTRSSTLATSKFRLPDDRNFRLRRWMVSVVAVLGLAVQPGSAVPSTATVERTKTTVEQDASLVRVMELHLGSYSLPLPMLLPPLCLL